MSCKIRNCGTVVVLVVLFTSSVAVLGQTMQFQVRALRGLGGTQTTAYGINNLGWVTGGGSLPGDLSEHGILWRAGTLTDLGTLGGPNSSAGNPLKNDVGLIQGFSQIKASDPLGEGWVYDCLELLSGVTQCQDITRITLGFVWQNNVMTALPTLGGNNAQAWGANDSGQIVGIAETSVRDASCTPPQILDFEAVIWTPSQGLVQELPPYHGDKGRRCARHQRVRTGGRRIRCLCSDLTCDSRSRGALGQWQTDINGEPWRPSTPRHNSPAIAQRGMRSFGALLTRN